MLRAFAIGSAALAAALGGSVGAGSTSADGRRAPAPCSPAGVARLIDGFFTAFNRATLARYIAARHRHHERLRLVNVLVASRGGRADIQFRLRRDADDLGSLGIPANRRLAFGKGAVLCRRGKIFVWSAVHPDEPVDGPTCPGGARACRPRP